MGSGASKHGGKPESPIIKKTTDHKSLTPVLPDVSITIPNHKCAYEDDNLIRNSIKRR